VRGGSKSAHLPRVAVVPPPSPLCLPSTTHPRNFPFFDQYSHALPPAVLQAEGSAHAPPRSRRQSPPACRLHQRQPRARANGCALETPRCAARASLPSASQGLRNPPSPSPSPPLRHMLMTTARSSARVNARPVCSCSRPCSRSKRNRISLKTAFPPAFYSLPSLAAAAAFAIAQCSTVRRERVECVWCVSV
jgi:hypothetical protein